MKKSWAMKWVKALRSGKYEQTTGTLRDKNGHCCLGVLCSLTKYKNNYTKFARKEATACLPTVVQKFVKMKTTYGHTTKGRLSSLNDNGTSFETIADIIEKEWETL